MMLWLFMDRQGRGNMTPGGECTVAQLDPISLRQRIHDGRLVRHPEVYPDRVPRRWLVEDPFALGIQCRSTKASDS